MNYELRGHTRQVAGISFLFHLEVTVYERNRWLNIRVEKQLSLGRGCRLIFMTRGHMKTTPEAAPRSQKEGGCQLVEAVQFILFLKAWREVQPQLVLTQIKGLQEAKFIPQCL